jgi:hypothetical protein
MADHDENEDEDFVDSDFDVETFTKGISNDAPSPAPGNEPAQREEPSAPPEKTVEDASKTPAPPAEKTAQSDEGQRPAPAPAAPVDGVPAAEKPAEAPVFGFTADRKQYTFDGSRVTDEGILIPRKYEPQLRDLLAEGVTHRGSFRETLQAVREDADTRVALLEERVARAESTAKEWSTFAEHFGQLREQGPDAIAEWLDAWDKNMPELAAKAKEAGVSALEQFYREKTGRNADGTPYVPEGGRAAAQAEPEEPAVQFTDEQVRAELDLVLSEIPSRAPQFAGLTPALQKEVAEEIMDMGLQDRVFALAVRSGQQRVDGWGDQIFDVPFASPERPVILTNGKWLTSYLQRKVKAATGSAQQVAAASEAEKANARRGVAPTTTPPNPGRNADPARDKATGKFTGKRTFKNRAEFNAYVDTLTPEQLLAMHEEAQAG